MKVRGCCRWLCHCHSGCRVPGWLSAVEGVCKQPWCRCRPSSLPQLTHFTCPGHEDPQPRDCPFAWAVPPTVVLPGDAGSGSAPATPQRPAGWLSWARRWAQRLGLGALV